MSQKSRAELQERSGSGEGERIVYVVPEEFTGENGGEIDLVELARVLWSKRWRVLGVAGIFALASVAYALLAPEWFRASVLLAPKEAQSAPAIGGQLGGLAALAGVSIGGANQTEALAVLRSRDFARAFIEDRNLLPVLFEKQWDVDAQRWRGSDPEDVPDLRDAIERFHKEVLSVREEAKTGLVTLSVEWTDPRTAAEWASALVSRLNARMRDRALREAEANVAYLREQLGDASIRTLQQSISSLLESELQQLMLARGREEFAFAVIDSPEVPKEQVRPRRPLIAVLGTMLGGLAGVVWVLLSHFLGRREDQDPAASTAAPGG